jgi:hypothetical protein
MCSITCIIVNCINDITTNNIGIKFIFYDNIGIKLYLHSFINISNKKLK